MRPGPRRRQRLAEAARVVAHDAPDVRQRGPLRIPHPAIRDSGVDKDDWIPVARHLIGQTARRPAPNGMLNHAVEYARLDSKSPILPRSHPAFDRGLGPAGTYLPGRSRVGRMRANGRPAGRTFFETSPDLGDPTHGRRD